MGQQVERVRGTLKEDGQVILEDVEFVVVVVSKRWHATLTLPELGNVEMKTYLLELADGRVGKMGTTRIEPGSPWVISFQGTGPLAKPS